MAQKFIMTELEVWQSLHGPSEECVATRQEADRDFQSLFPLGHKQSLREFVAETYWYIQESGVPLPGKVKQLLEQFHPDALKLLVMYGRNYRPVLWKRARLETLDLQPIPRHCAVNSVNYMRAANRNFGFSKYVYVEGMAMGSLNLPMLHAWTAKGISSYHARDWTLYASTPWTRYLGIPLTPEEHEKAWRLCYPRSMRTPLLLDRRHFPKVEGYLTELLEKRPPVRLETQFTAQA